MIILSWPMVTREKNKKTRVRHDASASLDCTLFRLYMFGVQYSYEGLERHTGDNQEKTQSMSSTV